MRGRALESRLWLSFVATAVAAGVTLALGAAPAAVLAGFAVTSAARQFNSLPNVLSVTAAPQRSALLAADGSTIATFYSQDRVDVRLDQIAPVMQQAIVAIEDARFYSHGGIDPTAILRAAATDLVAGGSVQGASTLTQQYVKNLLIDAARTPAERRAASADTISRKLQEARYAVHLAHTQSRAQILQGYLNTVYFGDGSYGIEAASRHYFSEPATQLTLPQAALLAGLVQNPSAFDPIAHPNAALTRRGEVLTRMSQLGMVPASQADAAGSAPLELNVSPHPGNGCAAATAPYFCQWVVSALLQDPGLGSDPAARQATLQTGGVVVRTTLDPRAQEAAQRAVQLVDPASRAAAAVVVVQPGTGDVLAMAVNRPFGTDMARNETTVNLATGGSSGYQAGSTFKLFTLTAALEQGMSPVLTLNAPASYTVTGLRNCSTGAVFPPYTVGNAEPNSGGRITLRQATWESVNTFFVQVEQRTGLCAPAQVASAMGVTHPDGSAVDPVPSFTLGSAEVSPLTMATAYATIAARGIYCPPSGILAITAPDGRTTAPPGPACRQAVPTAVADAVTQILRGVIDGPDRARTGANAHLTVPAAGKTGTTDNFGAAWFDGYTNTLAAAVWVGDPRGSSNSLSDITINGTYYRHLYGGDVPAKIWATTMQAAVDAGVGGPPPSAAPVGP